MKDPVQNVFGIRFHAALDGVLLVAAIRLIFWAGTADAHFAAVQTQGASVAAQVQSIGKRQAEIKAKVDAIGAQVCGKCYLPADPPKKRGGVESGGF